MSEQKGTKVLNTHESTRKVCSRVKEHKSTRSFSSRVKEHETRTTTIVVTERKYKTHGGMKLNLNQKLKTTVPKPFSFDTGPKIRKGSPCSHLTTERSPMKQLNGDVKDKGAKREIKVTTTTLTVPMATAERSKSRSLSRERTQNSATKVETASKKACSRLSRIAKPLDVQPPKAEKSPVLARKSVKSEASNASKSQNDSSKASKSGTQSSKPQVHFSDNEKSEMTKSFRSTVAVSKSETISATKVVSGTSTELKLQNGLEKVNEHRNEGNIRSETLNGFVPHFALDPSGPESPNLIDLQSELASAMKVSESNMQTQASKIPRKKLAPHSGLKFRADFKKEIMGTYELKMENKKGEVVPITSMAN